MELLRSGDELHVAACSVRSLELAPLLLVDLALLLLDSAALSSLRVGSDDRTAKVRVLPIQKARTQYGDSGNHCLAGFD